MEHNSLCLMYIVSFNSRYTLVVMASSHAVCACGFYLVSPPGVGAIDRVVEAAEAALKGEQLVLLGRRKLPDLDLPKVCQLLGCQVV